MNVKMCKQKWSFFLQLRCGTASGGDRVLFQPFHFSRDVPRLPPAPLSIPFSHKRGCLDTADFYESPKHLSVTCFEHPDSFRWPNHIDALALTLL